jgi:8-oxo-dGTP pyrophosphatase MutT (NUDIX family)
MKGDRPAPGELLHEGPPTTPRQAASVILLRGGGRDLEILLVKRNPAQRFMGGAWVFPGGAVDAREGEGDAAHRLAAVREVREEAGLELPGPDALVKFSRWITPAQVKIRFDTHFFLAPVADDARARVDGRECVDLGWFRPGDALAAYARDEILLVFPTIKHLEQLSAFSSADELLRYAAGRRIEAVEPMVVSEGETARLVLPGEGG